MDPFADHRACSSEVFAWLLVLKMPLTTLVSSAEAMLLGEGGVFLA